MTAGSLLVVDAALLGEPSRRGWLWAEGGAIRATGTGAPPAIGPGCEVLDAAGASLLPGFVDLHLHGAVGHDVTDGDAAGLRAIARFLVRHGVTAFAPTTWSASAEATLAAVESVAAVRGPVTGGAHVLGAHLEGPWLSPSRCGAQDPAALRPPDLGELRRLLATGGVARVTLAPELPGAQDLLDAALDAGVAMSMGHSDASYALAASAVDRGVRSATHLYNAMRPLHHRDPGVVGAVLADPRVTAELIADGTHVHPAALRVAWNAKGADGLALVSDALRPTGLPAAAAPDGRTFHRSGGTIHGSAAPGPSSGPRSSRSELPQPLASGRVEQDPAGVSGGCGRETGPARPPGALPGAVWLADGTLAGSTLLLDAALRTMTAATGAPLVALWPVTSRTPARVLGIDGRKGGLEPGMDGDLVLLDSDLRVLATVVAGCVVHAAEHPRVRAGGAP